MTGFGRGTATAKGSRIVVEISSVNRKGFEISLLLPENWSEIEAQIRELVAAQASRGRITVRMKVERIGHGSNGPRVNLDAARQIEKEFQQVSKKLGIPYVASLDRLLAVSGVVQWDQREAVPAVPALGIKAVKAALDDWEQARLAEGKKLVADMRRRLARLRQLRVRILRATPKVVQGHRQRLAKRLEEAGAAMQSGAFQELLRTELALFADRCDVAEELTRLDVHLQRYETILTEPHPGRKLDFLLQEMHREVNTTGAKANDSGIAQDVVEMKTEVERLREQVQNLE